MDVGMNLAAHHLQSDFFTRKPPSLASLSLSPIGSDGAAVQLSRERVGPRKSFSEYRDSIRDVQSVDKHTRTFWPWQKHSSPKAPSGKDKKRADAGKGEGSADGIKNIGAVLPHAHAHDSSGTSTPTNAVTSTSTTATGTGKVGDMPAISEHDATPVPGLPSDLWHLHDNKQHNNSDDGHDDDNHEIAFRSPFLHEAAHLLSLLSAVAMATLRNDIEGTESPLTEYEPGKPWPDEDPDALNNEIREQYDEASRFWTGFYFVFGVTRSARHRTLYNAARPFGVIGGVSDEEVEALQRARGPYAKVSLCFMWLQEFFTREHLQGGTGPIHAAIISRLHQFSSDGMRG